MGACGILVLSGGTSEQDLATLPASDLPHLVTLDASSLLSALRDCTVAP